MKFTKVSEQKNLKQGQIFRSMNGHVCVVMVADDQRIGYWENAGLWFNIWKDSEQGSFLVEVK